MNTPQLVVGIILILIALLIAIIAAYGLTRDRHVEAGEVMFTAFAAIVLGAVLAGVGVTLIMGAMPG